MRNNNYLILSLVLLFIFLNYSFIDSLLIQAFEEESEVGICERVVDGDTIVVNGSKVRMLAINSPESGEVGYDEAKNFLISEIEGKEVILKFGKEKFDLYQRKLAYVFLGNRNINLESVQNGYSSFYFPSGKDKYFSLFFDSWGECLIDEIGICQKSNDNCIVIDWRPLEDSVTLKNICSYSIDLNSWSVKDEGRKKYIFTNKILEGFGEIWLSSEDWEKSYVWTKSGDSIFVRDDKNGLVIWDTY